VWEKVWQVAGHYGCCVNVRWYVVGWAQRCVRCCGTPGRYVMPGGTAPAVLKCETTGARTNGHTQHAPGENRPALPAVRCTAQGCSRWSQPRWLGGRGRVRGLVRSGRCMVRMACKPAKVMSSVFGSWLHRTPMSLVRLGGLGGVPSMVPTASAWRFVPHTSVAGQAAVALL